MVRIEEVQSMSAHARHAAVRVLYHTKTAFKKSAKTLGIMDDFKAGVPRMAYRGVVSVMNRSVYCVASTLRVRHSFGFKVW